MVSLETAERLFCTYVGHELRTYREYALVRANFSPEQDWPCVVAGIAMGRAGDMGEIPERLRHLYISCRVTQENLANETALGTFVLNMCLSMKDTIDRCYENPESVGDWQSPYDPYEAPSPEHLLA